MEALSNFSPTVQQLAGDPDSRAVPVVDLRTLLSAKRSQKACLIEIERACTGTGFFAITGHGISQKKRNELHSTAARFFAQDAAFKQNYQIGLNGSHSGYVPFSEKGLYDDETGQRMYEAFDLSLDLPSSDLDHQQGNIFYGPNCWPDIEGFKFVVDGYYNQMRQLSHVLVNAFEKILGMPAGHIRSKMDKPTSQLRLIHYIAGAQTAGEEKTNMGAHTDYELFTILYSRSPGLQTQNLEGDWIDVPVLDGTFTINIGDMLEVWSNGKFKSNLHRVLNNGMERFSFPYFASLNYDTVVTPWRRNGLAMKNSRYKSVVSGDHLLQQVCRDFAYLREQISRKSNPFLTNVLLETNPYQNTVAPATEDESCCRQ